MARACADTYMMTATGAEGAGSAIYVLINTTVHKDNEYIDTIPLINIINLYVPVRIGSSRVDNSDVHVD